MMCNFKHMYKFHTNNFCGETYKMATVQSFENTCKSFQVLETCTSQNIMQRLITKLYNLKFVASVWLSIQIAALRVYTDLV